MNHMLCPCIECAYHCVCKSTMAKEAMDNVVHTLCNKISIIIFKPRIHSKVFAIAMDGVLSWQLIL